MKDTFFEIQETGCDDYKFKIIQRFRTVYYEDVVNPSKYRDCITAICETKEIADKLCAIFNNEPFTDEFLRKNNTYWDKKFKLRNAGSRSRTEYEIYSCSNSQVKYEEDLYNGTDQSVFLYQMMKDKKRKYSGNSKEKVICKLWNEDYVIPVINNTKKLFYEDI